MSNLPNYILYGLLAVILMLSMTVISSAETYPAGEINGDGSVNVSDAVSLINYIFSSGDAPVDMSSADVNNDCKVNVSDAVCIISYVFGGGVTELVRGCRHDEVTGFCDMEKEQTTSPTVITFEVIGHNLFITHYDAYYQCCLGYDVEYQLNGNQIIAQEVDLGSPCDCYCDFDILQSVFYNLSEGEYMVTLIGIEGDTLAGTSVQVGTDYGLVDYEQGECHSEKSVSGAQDFEYIYWNDTLVMHHSDAYYLCGSILQFEYERAGDYLYFYEIEYVPEYPPPCMCYYDIKIVIAGVEPGQYYARVYSVWPQLDDDDLLDSRWLDLN